MKIIRNKLTIVQDNVMARRDRSREQRAAFAMGIRQASDSTAPWMADPEKAIHPKIATAVGNLTKRLTEDKNFRGVVYSNFIGAGIEPYSRELTRLGIAHQKITGKLTAKEREQIIHDYNTGKIRVLLISSAGGEGLDLKGTKLVQVMEPHWNEEKIKQVIGRGVRYQSHAHLPPEERHVEVERYLSTIQPGVLDKIMRNKNPTSIDEYLHNRSKDKNQLHNQIRDLIKRSQQRKYKVK